MENSVIETLNSRIEFYTKAADIRYQAELTEIKKVVSRLKEDQSLFNSLEVYRLLELLKIKMGKRTTVTLYLEQDIGIIKGMLEKQLKNNGRGFVDNMKDIYMQNRAQGILADNNQFPDQGILTGGESNSMSKSYVKTKSNPSARYIFPAE